MLKKALAVSFACYILSFMTSMAGVEFFSWLTFTLGIITNIVEVRAGRVSWRNAFFCLGPDLALWALVVVVLLGFYINAAPETTFAGIVGGVRFVPMMYGIAYAIRWIGLTDTMFAPYMIVAGIASIHGIAEFFTGWDYVRHRPITRMIEGANGQDARACGFFAMPTTYGNAAAMTMCFPVAAWIIGWTKKTWENWAVAIGGALVLAGIGLSFTRAAWIALVAAVIIMGLYKGFRTVVKIVVVTVILGGAFIGSKPEFRYRVATIFDNSYHSNTGRLQMWQTNWWMVQDYPILGIGFNDNERRGPEYNDKHGVKDVHLGNAHNTYLQFLAGTGILGLLAYLCFIGYYLWLTIKLLKVIPEDQIWQRTFVLGSLGAQVVLHVVGLMDCNFKSMIIQHQFVAFMAILSYLRFVYLTPMVGVPKKVISIR